jgi:uncharacterized membrane protein YczE
VSQRRGSRVDLDEINLKPARMTLTTSRSTALAARWGRLLAGLVLIGEAIALNVRSELGLGPLFVVFQGLHRHGIATIGTAAILTNAVLLVAALALRERPGFGTLGQVFVVGPLADLGLWLTPTADGLALRWTYLILCFVLLCAGAALYLSADLGAGPYDAVMRGIYRRTHRWSLWGVRICMESTALLIGWSLGGDVGVGTLVIGAGIGPGMWLGLRLLRAMPEKVHAAVDVASLEESKSELSRPRT